MVSVYDYKSALSRLMWKTGLFKFRFVDFKDTIEISRSIFQDVIWAWSLDINDPHIAI